jgi:hypothetical protein
MYRTMTLLFCLLTFQPAWSASSDSVDELTLAIREATTFASSADYLRSFDEKLTLAHAGEYGRLSLGWRNCNAHAIASRNYLKATARQRICPKASASRCSMNVSSSLKRCASAIKTASFANAPPPLVRALRKPNA